MYNADTTLKAPCQCYYINHPSLNNERTTHPKAMGFICNTPYEALCITLFLTYS